MFKSKYVLAGGEGGGAANKSAFKWIVVHLQGKIIDQLRDRWVALPEEASFSSKLRHLPRFYKELSKCKPREYRKEELH